MTSSTSTEPQPVPGTSLALGPRIDCPHAVCRPLLPRGLHIRTTKPAAACICASSKNVSPYWVNGPPCTLRSTGYVRLGSKSAGRISQASIEPVPSEHGTANFSQPCQGVVRFVTAPSSVYNSLGRSTV